MATERLAMHQAREILRLKLTLKRTHRVIMKAVGVSMGTVSGVMTRATALGLDWEAVKALDDEALDVRLHGPLLRCDPSGRSRVFPLHVPCQPTGGAATASRSVGTSTR